MSKWHVLLIMTAGLALLFACNKQKPHKLDYTHKAEMYNPRGLPGDSHIGGHPDALKQTGIQGEGAEGGKKPDEKKPDIQKDEEKKAPEPEEKTPEPEKKPEEEKAPGKDTEKSE
jgi:hypothetical protein